MNLKIAICEDDKYTCEYLEKKIQLAFQAQKHAAAIYSFVDPIKLYADAQRHEYNVFFLDIDMPGMDGIALASALRNIDPSKYIMIIFISNKDDMVYLSLQTCPFRFIRKSHFDEEISEAVRGILHYYDQYGYSSFTIESNGKIVTLQIPQIQFVEAINKVQIVHASNQQYSVFLTITELERVLGSYGFLRVHKSFLVNYMHIHCIHKNSVQLVNGIEIPLSKHRAADVKKEYFSLIQDESTTL